MANGSEASAVRLEQPAGAAVTFTVLGSLEILKNGVDHAPTAPKILQLMAMLLLQPGRVVQTASLVAELWDDAPPRSVRTTLQTYVYQVRRCIEQNELADDPESMLATKPPGYVLRIDPAQVDVFRFRQLCAEARSLAQAGLPGEAAGVYRAALALWSGPPLANVSCGPVLSAFAVELQEQRRHAQHQRIEAEIAAGSDRELVGELSSLVASNRLDEALHGQLMRVLGRSGRRSDAMSIYRQLRARLSTELGVDPCDELQDLHLQLISDGDRPR